MKLQCRNRHYFLDERQHFEEKEKIKYDRRERLFDFLFEKSVDRLKNRVLTFLVRFFVKKKMNRLQFKTGLIML